MSNLEKKKYWIWLSLISNLGNKKKQELLKEYKNPEKIYNLEETELLKVRKIGEKTIKNILDKNIRKNMGKHVEYMQKNNIDIISIYDKEYPQKLKEIYDPPISLYAKGDITILNQKAISIVGCREASDYGRKAAKYFSYNLARKGYNIISGLARSR